MNYRGVGRRCAVDFRSLKLPLSPAETQKILEKKGFEVIEVDMVALARRCITISTYRRGARPSEAPGVFDCSSFTQWLYGMRGIWLPRRSIQQREFGKRIAEDDIRPDDLIFSSGYRDYYWDDPNDGVGHVGIVTGEGTAVHAANKNAGIIESPLSCFVGNGKFRGAARYISDPRKVLTLRSPDRRDVEQAEDFRWIVLQSL